VQGPYSKTYEETWYCWLGNGKSNQERNLLAGRKVADRDDK
jgi:hypothetical protein